MQFRKQKRYSLRKRKDAVKNRKDLKSKISKPTITKKPQYLKAKNFWTNIQVYTHWEINLKNNIVARLYSIKWSDNPKNLIVLNNQTIFIISKVLVKVKSISLKNAGSDQQTLFSYSYVQLKFLVLKGQTGYVR